MNDPKREDTLDQQQPNTQSEKGADKPLGFFEVLIQGIALIFAIQNHAGRKRLMDLAETNPLPVVIAGLASTVLFFSFCFLTSQFFIHILSK
ncbi:DUF2970 domain-containing protein [Litorivivens sp.]|uniref:DUF2970 domain-containing protein n=1 Tax=Litorivivens sp. TaxID=2020868 RepID=UPI003563B310